MLEASMDPQRPTLISLPMEGGAISFRTFNDGIAVTCVGKLSAGNYQELLKGIEEALRKSPRTVCLDVTRVAPLHDGGPPLIGAVVAQCLAAGTAVEIRGCLSPIVGSDLSSVPLPSIRPATV